MSTVEHEEPRRLFEHFIVAGLSANAEELTPLEHECGNKPNEVLPPITDIAVIFPGHGEVVPPGYTCIETTPSGHPADLNHGSIRTHSAFLCYRRSYGKPPLVDIGIMDESKKERPLEDSTVIQYSPNGRPANVSNTSNQLFFTYRRCKPDGPPHQLVLTHISVIITSKGEAPPHTFFKIDKNLNKAMVGSDVYVCYKKSQSCCRRIAYKPAVLDCFPQASEKEYALTQNVPMFCLPMGAVIESWSAKCGKPTQLFSTCVLTDAFGTKYYGASLTFYEKYTKELTKHQSDTLSFEGDESLLSEDEEPAGKQLFFMNKAICIVSKHPFFESFRRFLHHVYYLSAGEPSKIPIERYISYLMYEVPFPTLQRPRVLVQMGVDMIPFENHDDSQVPLSGAQFIETLKCLGVENFIYAMTIALLEQKILIHSLRPWLLTVVSETICALMFPFHWQCPYIPQCPLEVAGVLHAPLPFIAGVDSRYFDLYEDPPSDVICFDLDTSTVRHSVHRRSLKHATLPKKPLRKLRNALEEIQTKLRDDDRELERRRGRLAKSDGMNPGDFDQQIQDRRKNMEVQIREAFLRFMCSLMSDYTRYLKPIMSRPNEDENYAQARFNLEKFLATRDVNSTEFYKRFSETQCFMQFIKERSFMSDKVAYNAFFDDCLRRVMTNDSSSQSLLDRDPYSVNHTIVVPPPQLLNPNSDTEEYAYTEFPSQFKHELFELNEIQKSAAAKPVESSLGSSDSSIRYALVRTKQEILSSNESGARWLTSYPILWPRFVLFYAYSLWFLQLPSMVAKAQNKLKVLRLAFSVLNRLHHANAPILDQVIYRIIMHLCGKYGYPMLAVDVLRKMQSFGYQPNAITYAVYHGALQSSEWPSDARLIAIDAWRRVRLRIDVVAAFRAIRKTQTAENINAMMEGGIDPEGISTLSLEETTSMTSSPANTTDEEDEALKDAPFVITVTPLPPKANGSLNSQSDQSTSNPDPLNASTHSVEDRSARKSQSCHTASPSREQYFREHNASPFAKDIATIDDRLASKRKSLKIGSTTSWLRKLASSPVVSNLMRSNTTENIRQDANESLNTSTQSGYELAPPQSSITMSPSLSSLVSQFRKGYESVSHHGNTLLKKSGVNNLVNEVKNLNKSYSKDNSFTGSSGDDSVLNTTGMTHNMALDDPAFRLRSGKSGDLLPLEYWMKEFLSDPAPEGDNGDGVIIDATLCSATKCPRCHYYVYDEEIIHGWILDDNNLNTKCPYCLHGFAPSLLVNLSQDVKDPTKSFYKPFIASSFVENPEVKVASESLSVPLVSPVVLRRELEALLSVDMLTLLDPALRTTHPTIFWNLIYYLRRLDLPSHLYTWISRNVHVRCVYDRPDSHASKAVLPLYLATSMVGFIHRQRRSLSSTFNPRGFDDTETGPAASFLKKAEHLPFASLSFLAYRALLQLAVQTPVTINLNEPSLSIITHSGS
uniref:UDENN domain-containing protein n=1 Tax=Panagrellus redivivus TaxID=6233 RepID=A0A7E4W0N1_PANRE